jgi:type I restriction enzyme M protein
MDLRQIGEPFEKKFTQFGVDDIKNITDTYHNWQQTSFETTYKNIPEFCYSAGFDEVVKKEPVSANDPEPAGPGGP